MKSHPAIAGIYRVAILCGAGPLIVGTSIFLLWLATDWEWLMTAGLWTILLGLLLFGCGVLGLIYYCYQAWGTSGVPRRRLLFAEVLCVCLLLANFPAAYAYTLIAYKLLAVYSVTIVNDGNVPVERIRIYGGGCDVTFTNVQPGDQISESLKLRQDGELRLDATYGGSRQQMSIETVTSYSRGDTYVAVQPDGTITVVTHHRHG